MSNRLAAQAGCNHMLSGASGKSSGAQASRGRTALPCVHLWPVALVPHQHGSWLEVPHAYRMKRGRIPPPSCSSPCLMRFCHAPMQGADLCPSHPLSRPQKRARGAEELQWWVKPLMRPCAHAGSHAPMYTCTHVPVCPCSHWRMGRPARATSHPPLQLEVCVI